MSKRKLEESEAGPAEKKARPDDEEGFGARVGAVSKQSVSTPQKPNQDRWLSRPPKADAPSSIGIFGVFDGHGSAGHHVAQWVCDNIATYIDEVGRRPCFLLSLNLLFYIGCVRPTERQEPCGSVHQTGGEEAVRGAGQAERGAEEGIKGRQVGGVGGGYNTADPGNPPKWQ